MKTSRLLSRVLVILALSAALATPVNAAPHHLPDAGNRGGCGRGNWWTNLACTVTAAGPGFVSGTCQWGLGFSRVPTARTFRLDQAVHVNGCEGLNNTLYAPIRISK